MSNSENIFLGLFMVTWGVSIILKRVFAIDFPFFAIGAGMFLIYWGLTLLITEYYLVNY